jgi:hypothetical protein
MLRYTRMLLLTAMLMAMLTVGGAWADADDTSTGSDDASTAAADGDEGRNAPPADSSARDDPQAANASDSGTDDAADAARADDDTVTTFGPQAPAAMAQDVAGNAPSVEDRGAAEAEQVMQRLLEQRRQIPTIEPVVTGSAAGGAGGQRPDPAIIGVAPDQPAPQLRREGEFIVSRRGRVFILPDGRAQFRFHADAEQSPEPPMFLMPCQLLEHIERLVHQRGDELLFVLSGQVFTYQGGNWLLPTMMRLDIHRDALGQ